MEPKLADETWGKLGGEIVPVPVVAPPEIAELLLFEAVWLFQLRLSLDLIEAWWAPARPGSPEDQQDRAGVGEGSRLTMLSEHRE
jgi:hypothetical protein